MQNKTLIMTTEGLAKAQHELNHLKNVRRPAVIEKIAVAKEQGDLSENAEYHDAKDEQGIIETRIAELEHLMKNAIIQETASVSDQVQLGSLIVVDDGNSVSEYKIVGFNEADPSSGLISNESPFAQAFMGHKQGDKVDVGLPSGAVKRFTIKEIK